MATSNPPQTPPRSAEEFPSLGRPEAPAKLEEIFFKRFLIIKKDTASQTDQDDNQKNIDPSMSDVNVFVVDRSLKSILGKHYKWCKISRLRSGLLLVEVVQRQAFDLLKRVTKIGEVSVIVEEHQTLNTSKGFIICDDIRGMTNEDIQKELESQNVKEVYRIQRRKSCFGPPNKNSSTSTDQNFILEPTDQFIMTFSTPKLPRELKVGYLLVKVRPYIPNPRRCNKCQMYGHVMKFCKLDLVCPKCGQKGHERKNCSSIPKCIHCTKDHEATSKNCPMWKLEKLIIEEKTKNNIDFKQARTRIYSSYSNLVSQIPKLNTNKPNSTASNIVSNQSELVASLLDTIEHLKNQNETLTKKLHDLSTFISHHKGSSDSDMDTNLPSISPYLRKKSKKIRLGYGKRHKGAGESSDDGNSAPSSNSSPSRRKTPNVASEKEAPTTSQVGSNLAGPPVPLLEGTTSNRPEVIVPDLSSQPGLATSAEMGDSPPVLEASGGKSTQEEEGDGFLVSQHGKQKRLPNPHLLL